MINTEAFLPVLFSRNFDLSWMKICDWFIKADCWPPLAKPDDKNFYNILSPQTSELPQKSSFYKIVSRSSFRMQVI